MTRGVPYKITRDAFLYLDPKLPRGAFAQCETCRMWTGKRCTILGPAVEVDAGDSCGLYVPGEPNTAGKVMKSLTPKEAGFVSRQVRCENCIAFDGKGKCKLFMELNKKAPEFFNLTETVHRQGCCNAQQAKAHG